MTVKSSDPPAGQDPSHSHDPPPSYQASTTDTSSSTDPSSPSLSHPLPASNIYPNIRPYPSLPPTSGPGAGPMHHSPSFGAGTPSAGANVNGRGYTESSHLHPCPHPAVHYQHQQQQQQQQQLYRPHPHAHHSQHAYGRPEEWTPPANDTIARARARRRFFVAFCWGFLIYLILGSIVGSSQLDIHNSHNRKYHPHPYSANALSASAEATSGDFSLGDNGGEKDLLATTPIPVQDVEVVAITGEDAGDRSVNEGGSMPSF